MSISRQRRGLLAVIGSTVAIFFPGAMTFGYPGVMGPYWMKTFDVGKGAVGLCLFFLLAMVGIFMFTAGKLQEKYGTRAMIRAGAVVIGIAAVVSAAANSIYMIYLWALLNGMGVSLIYIPGLTTVQKWFPQKKGLVSGWVNFSFGISAALMVPLFAQMLKALPYLTMNLVIGAVAVVVSLIGAQFTEVPERTISAGNSERSRTTEPVHGRDNPVPQRAFTLKQALRTRAFWFLWLVWAFVGASCISMVPLSIPFGLSHNLSFSNAALILTSFNLTSGLIRILAGYLSDLISRKKLMASSFFMACVAFFLLPNTSSLPAICGLTLFIGLAFGALFALSAPLVSDCFGLKHFGTIFGFIFTAYGFVASMLGPALSGNLLEKGVSFQLIFTYFGILAGVSGVLILLVAPPQREA